MTIRSTSLLIVASCLSALTWTAVRGVGAQGHGNKDIKVLIWGGVPGSGGQPSPGEFIANHKTAATFPADGIVFNLTHDGGYFVDDGFSSNARLFTYRQMKKGVNLWQSFNLGNLKHNFVRVNIGMVPDCLGNDRQWDIVLKNVALAARGARECRAEGIMLDTEMYHCYSRDIAPFRYDGHLDLMFNDYKKHVRRRGKQFMTAVNSEMPNAKLLMTYATSSACRPPHNPKLPLSYNIMALMPAFVDGMMDAATANNEIIDCYEASYGYKSRAEFARARDVIKKQAAELSADPERYSKMIRVGFGLFAHGGAAENSLSEDVSKNTHTPSELYDTLRYAAEFSDGYVWLYSLPWMTMPPAYLEAVHDFRRQQTALRAHRTFYAKQMTISNTSPSKSPEAGTKNWFLAGDYVTLSSNPATTASLNSTGAVTFSPRENDAIADGLYEIVVDVVHSNVKKHNAGSPPGDRNGFFSYRISLRPESTGHLSFCTGSTVKYIQYHPADADNCNPGGVGSVALTDFIAYGPNSPAGAIGAIELTGVKHSDILFELRDDVLLNYGTIGIKSITLIPVRLRNYGNQSK